MSLTGLYPRFFGTIGLTLAVLLSPAFAMAQDSEDYLESAMDDASEESTESTTEEADSASDADDEGLSEDATGDESAEDEPNTTVEESDATSDLAESEDGSATKATEDSSSEPMSPAMTTAPATSAHDTVIFGLNKRETVSYGAMGAGGLIFVGGLVHLLTRDDTKRDLNEDTNVLTITKRQSRAPSVALMAVGAGVAGIGAFLMWVEPELGWNIFGDNPPRGSNAQASGFQMRLTPGIGGFALNGTF